MSESYEPECLSGPKRRARHPRCMAWKTCSRAVPLPKSACPSRLTDASYFVISRNMETRNASEALSALGHENRLRVFRLLMRHGLAGLSAGSISDALGVAPNTLSAHLTVLVRAGLITSRRQGRLVIYAVDFDGTKELLAFLMEDCCRAERKISHPLITSALSNCC